VVRFCRLLQLTDPEAKDYSCLPFEKLHYRNSGEE